MLRDTFRHPHVPCEALAARHGVDALGCVTFCGATLVPVRGGGGTPRARTFAHVASPETEAIWAKNRRFTGNLDKLRRTTAELLDAEAARLERGEFPSDAALTASIAGRRIRELT